MKGKTLKTRYLILACLVVIFSVVPLVQLFTSCIFIILAVLYFRGGNKDNGIEGTEELE
jgi:hypothetical protein